MNPTSISAHASSHGTGRRAAIVWGLLILATLLTWTTGTFLPPGPAVAGILMSIAFVKGAMIILDYMALRRAPLLWPLVTLGWMLVVCALVGLAYWKGLPA